MKFFPALAGAVALAATALTAMPAAHALPVVPENMYPDPSARESDAPKSRAEVRDDMLRARRDNELPFMTEANPSLPRLSQHDPGMGGSDSGLSREEVRRDARQHRNDPTYMGPYYFN